MSYIPYGKHEVLEEDIKEVVKVLKSDFITSLLPNNYYKNYYSKALFFQIPQLLFPHKFYFCVTKNHSNQNNICKLENWYMTWSLNDVI